MRARGAAAGHVDDRAMALARHHVRRAQRAEERALEIGGQDLIPTTAHRPPGHGASSWSGWALLTSTSIALKRSSVTSKSRSTCALSATSRGHADRRAPTRDDRLGRVGGTRLVDVIHDHIRALRPEAQRDRPADPGTRAGDHGHLVYQPHSVPCHAITSRRNEEREWNGCRCQVCQIGRIFPPQFHPGLCGRFRDEGHSIRRER